MDGLLSAMCFGDFVGLAFDWPPLNSWATTEMIGTVAEIVAVGSAATAVAAAAIAAAGGDGGGAACKRSEKIQNTHEFDDKIEMVLCFQQHR